MNKKESRRRSPAAFALSHMLSHIETRFLHFLHLFLRKNTTEKGKRKADNPLKTLGLSAFSAWPARRDSNPRPLESEAEGENAGRLDTTGFAGFG